MAAECSDGGPSGQDEVGRENGLLSSGGASMSERFFISAPPHGGHATLAGDEARHLVRVLRATVGDRVRVFDGSGAEWPARVAAVGRDEVALDCDPPLPPQAEAGPGRLTLGVALPKGERQKWLVEKLTELGVARLVPLDTDRGVAEATPAARERLGRGVIEACKQCGRNRLMEIGAPRTVAAAIAAMPGGSRVVIADPGGAPLDPVGLAAGATNVLALVGPEGGFTAAELAAAEAAGAVRASLGPHVLRIETAAIALAARFTHPIR
jgi:16S rRNA (uracil1498-N3)-methyltransferase